MGVMPFLAALPHMCTNVLLYCYNCMILLFIWVANKVLSLSVRKSAFTEYYASYVKLVSTRLKKSTTGCRVWSSLAMLSATTDSWEVSSAKLANVSRDMWWMSGGTSVTDSSRENRWDKRRNASTCYKTCVHTFIDVITWFSTVKSLMQPTSSCLLIKQNRTAQLLDDGMSCSAFFYILVLSLLSLDKWSGDDDDDDQHHHHFL